MDGYVISQIDRQTDRSSMFPRPHVGAMEHAVLSPACARRPAPRLATRGSATTSAWRLPGTSTYVSVDMCIYIYIYVHTTQTITIYTYMI